MAERFILITTSGNPKNPKTWSGVPFQLTKAFNDLGVLLGAFNGDFPLFVRYLLLKTAALFFRFTKSDIIAPAVHREPFMYRLRQLQLDAKISFYSRKKTPVILCINPITIPSSYYTYCVYLDSILPQWQGKDMWCWTNQDRIPTICDRLNKQEKKILKQAFHVFTLSEWARQAIVNEYGLDEKKITAVGAGCVTMIGEFQSHESYDRKKLLFVGKDFKRKGGPLLVEAFKIAKQKDKDISLDIVGCKVDICYDGINVHGMISWEKLHHLYQEASLFVMPSYLEPFGMVFLEAAAARLPAIGLNRCATPEVIIDGVTGRLVEPDAKSLADIIVGLVNQPSLLKEMGENAYKIVSERWTWKNVVERMLPILIAARYNS